MQNYCDKCHREVDLKTVKKWTRNFYEGRWKEWTKKTWTFCPKCYKWHQKWERRGKIIFTFVLFLLILLGGLLYFSVES